MDIFSPVVPARLIRLSPATPGATRLWSFSALAGDVVSVSVDTPSSDVDPYVELRNAADGVLRSDDNSGPGNDSYINCFALRRVVSTLFL